MEQPDALTHRWRRSAMLLVGFAMAALVLEGASLPHLHDEPGWHNQEHDLGLFVALAAAGPATAPSTPVLLVPSGRVSLPAIPPPLARPWRHQAPRAPPTR